MIYIKIRMKLNLCLEEDFEEVWIEMNKRRFQAKIKMDC
jgi:hypothetical protein